MEDSRSRDEAEPVSAVGTLRRRFGLRGRSDLPDPSRNAYRADVADAALAGRVIASHYAEPAIRRLAAATPLLDNDGEPIRRLELGEMFALLDLARGQAWGYAVRDHLVGSMDAAALQDAD